MTREEIDQILTGAGQASAPQTMMTREQIDSIISGGQSPMQTNSGSTGVQIPAVSAAQKQTKNNPVLNRTLGMATHTSQALLGMSAADLKSKAKLLQRTASQKQEADDSKMPQQNQTANNAETASLWNAVERGGLSQREKLDKEMLQNKRIADNADIPQINNMNKEEYADSLVKYSADALTRLPSLKPQVDIPALDQPLAEVKSGERKPWSYDEFMEKSFEHAKHNAGRYSVNTPEVVKETYLDKWLQPGYKMNRDEIKQAKQYLKENALYYSGAGIDGQGDRRKAAQAAQIVSEWKGISPQEYMEKWDKLDKLHSKVNVGSSFFTGIESALPFITTLNDKYEKALNQWDKNAGSPVDRFDADYKGHFEERQGEAITQNPVPYVGGYLGTQMAKYKMGTAALDKLGVTGKLSGALSKVIKNEKVAGHAANVLGDTSLDVAFDTVPSLVGDVKEGEDAGTVAKNAAKNIGTNIAFNIGGEAVGAGISAISKSKKVKNILANPDTFTIETGVRLTGDGKTDKKIVTTYLDELDKATAELAKSAPVDDIVKSTPADDVVKNVPADDVAKSMPTDDVVESAVRNTDDMMQNSVESSQKIDSVDQANIKMIEEAQKEGFIPAVYERSNGIQKYSELQMGNLSSPKGKVNGVDSYEDFVRNSLNSKDSIKFYLGTVSEELNDDIMRSTGLDLSSYNVVFKSDDVRHSVNNHGSADEALRGQLPLTEDVLDKVPAVFNKPDLIKPLDTVDTYGRKAIQIEKRIDGKIITVEGISRGQHSLFIDTVYATPARTLNAKPSTATSETSTGVGRINSMLENSGNVNNEIPSPNTMSLSKVDQFSTGTGPGPAVSADPLKGSNATPARTVNARSPHLTSKTSTGVGRTNNMLENGGNVNSEIPSPTTVGLPKNNKTMAENIGLNGSELPWETPGGAKSVAEEMGIPDIRKYQQPQGDTLTVGGEKVSQFRTNTMAREGNFSPEEAAEVYGENFYKYIPKSEKETFDIAASRVASDADGWYQKYANAEDIREYSGSEHVDTMFQLSTSYRQQARVAKEAGNAELAQDLYAKSREMSLQLAKLERNAGQELQALQKYTSTADRALVNAENMIQDRTEKFIKDNPRFAEHIDEVGRAIYERVNELEQSDLWAQLVKGSAEFGSNNNPAREQIEQIVRQEIGKNKKLSKMMNDDAIGRLTDDLLRGRINHKITEALDTFASNGIYGVSDDVIDQVTDILEEAEKYGINSKDRVLAESQAYALLADQVAKSSFMDKWNAWRYLSMLGNTKTHGRNLVSTASMYATNGIKNNVAALIEAGTDKTSRVFGGKGIERTKAVLNPATDSGLIKLAKADADNSMYRQLKGNMYTGSIENSIESNKRIFKSKILNAASEGNSNLLDKEDYFFVKNKYATSLAGYLKANGADDTIFQAEKRLAAAQDQLAEMKKYLAEAENARGLNPLDGTAKQRVKELNQQMDSLKGQIKEMEKPVDLLERGRQYAKKQADEAAFHQDSSFAKKLTKFSKDLSEGNPVEKAVGMSIEGVVPFKKTPINVLKNSLAYSPANLVKNLSTDLYKLHKGTINAAGYIDSLAKTLTGSGIMAAGAYLYSKGIVSPQEDAESGKFDSLQGKQAYALNIGGKSYTLDWLSPGSIPFFTGATVMKAVEEKGIGLDTALNTLLDMSQPILEMSMMDGLNNTLESLRYGSDDSSPIGTLLGTIAGSYVKQGVPTVMGQIARATDNTRRSTYTDKTGFAGNLDREFMKMKNKIPVLSKTSQPYVDTWGREQQNLSGNPGMGKRLAYQMLSPGYMSDINVTPVDQEVQRLYDATSDKSVLPSDSTKKIDDVRMTKEEYTTYSKAAGQARYNLLESCLSNANYKALDEDVQAEVVKDLYGLAKKIGSAETRADYETKDKLYEAYSKGGIQGAVEYELQKNAITGTDLEVTDKTSKIYQESGEQGLQRYAQVQEYAKANFKDEKGDEKSSFSNVEYAEAVQSVVSDPAQQAELYLQSNPKDEKAGNIYNRLGTDGYTAYTNILQNGTNEKGKVSTIPTLKVLDSTGMSSEDKGYMLGQIKGMSSLAKGANRAYSRYGYGGIYDYYSIEKGADKDGNGSLKSRDELVPYLDARYQSKEVKRFWHSVLLPNTKNPY